MILTGDFKDQRLAAIAGEPLTVYPVTAADLLHLPACLACRSEETAIIAQVFIDGLEVFTTAACKQCGYVWRSVTPDAGWFARSARLLKTEIVINPALERARRMAYCKRQKFVAEYVKLKTALDVGAACGAGAKALIDAGYQVDVVEPDRERAIYLDAVGFNVHPVSIEDLLRHPHLSQYGLVMMCHVLEHCRDPIFVLANLHRLLPADGVAYIEVPSFGIINWSDALYLAHMSNFTFTSFSRLLRRVGSALQVIASRFFIHEGSRADIGLVLARKHGIEQVYQLDAQNTDDIARLYRAGLAPELQGPGVLKYRVPCFSHFNYGLRFNRYSARRVGEFIEMRED